MDPINTKRIPQIIQFLQTQNQTTRRDDKSTFYKPYYLTCDTNFFFFFFFFFSYTTNFFFKTKQTIHQEQTCSVQYKTPSTERLLKQYQISSIQDMFQSIYYIFLVYHIFVYLYRIKKEMGHSSTQIPLEFLLRASFAIT